MKNFIFAMCGFLMMSLASLNVQALSICEPIHLKSHVSAVDVGLPMIQNDVIPVAPNECFVMNLIQLAALSTVAEIPVAQSRSVVVPKYPFRYLYSSKYCTHYSHAAYNRLITPY